MAQVSFGGIPLSRVLAPLGIGPHELRLRQLGTAVVDHRTSWVRLLQANGNHYYLKVYDYPTAMDRCRGLLRFTGPGRPSRSRREAEALQWLRQHGFPAPTPVAVVEARRYGILHWAALLTEAWPGAPLDRLLAQLPAADRQQLTDAALAAVAAMHEAGFRDRNLDLRNLLARRLDDGSWQLAKIDSPRYRVRAPHRSDDALARADWQRLLPQFAAFGVAAQAPVT